MKKYFHIQRLDPYLPSWKEDEIITTPKDSDNYFQKSISRGLNKISSTRIDGNRFLKSTEKFKNEKSSTKFNLNLNDDFENQYLRLEELCYEFEELTDKLLKSNSQYLKWIREDIFEKTRALKFPNLPSRKRGIWLCSYDQVEFWWNRLGSQNLNSIIELELTNGGKLHLADEILVDIDSYSIDEFTQNSNSYWKGITNKKSKIEILYEGKLRVTKCYNDYTEWKETYT